MSNTSIGKRVAALEARDQSEGFSYILTAPSGNLLMIDQDPGEDMKHFTQRVREAWLAGGNPPELLPIECQADAELNP